MSGTTSNGAALEKTEHDVNAIRRQMDCLQDLDKINKSLEEMRRKIYLLQMFMDKAFDEVMKNKGCEGRGAFDTNRYVKHAIESIEKAISFESGVDIVELREYDCINGKDALLGNDPVYLQSILYNLRDYEIVEAEETTKDIIKHDLVEIEIRHEEVCNRIDRGLERKMRFKDAIVSLKNTHSLSTKRKFDEK